MAIVEQIQRKTGALIANRVRFPIVLESVQKRRDDNLRPGAYSPTGSGSGSPPPPSSIRAFSARQDAARRTKPGGVHPRGLFCMQLERGSGDERWEDVAVAVAGGRNRRCSV
ncbi:hypothetical protein GWI33_021888 [Rhynchophorus ferrugineus]|uniref:Uncharacterized protein n=1 Tax=Rhynchophorus ferrugineus TaxID=354439 RepID=A0A834HUD9_RHYFE|nr:hypothetical protein GWI33_021890 [Rhynchophorus ferrugineus]KAF7264955.1 hypothetical protein GWI33_021888 [Rhynchophorus ferrugineus]